jgi:hypothetical protein
VEVTIATGSHKVLTGRPEKEGDAEIPFDGHCVVYTEFTPDDATVNMARHEVLLI